MKHTPEPWRAPLWDSSGLVTNCIEQDCQPGGRWKDGGPRICSFDSAEIDRVNAERIVACVNACAGLKPEVLATLPDQIIECFSNWKSMSDEILTDIASDKQNVHWELANLILTARRAKEEQP